MTFAFPALAAIGAALAVAPIVVHLLNRRRRRVVAWAAMDFLLASQRINRTRIVLTEWLLLAARVAAIALVGLVAAGPRAADLLEDWFGSGGATHLVLLDDTASMQRRGPDGSAWDEALAAIERLSNTAREHGDRVTVVRYSDSLTGEAATQLVGEAATPVATSAWRAGNTAAAAPQAVGSALSVLEQLDSPGARRIYVLSDFAAASHRDDATWSSAIDGLARRVDGLVLAACGEPEPANLAVSSLALRPGPRAEGVEERLVIEVTNHHDEPAAEVTIGVERDGRSLTSLTVGPFDPREVKSIELPIQFSGAGSHVVEATAPADALGADNRRALAVETAAAREVLLVSDATAEARVFSAALRPLGRAASGWAPTRSERVTGEKLAEVSAVVVLDKPDVSIREADRLTAFARNGGGVLLVAGPQAEATWFNRVWNEVESPTYASRVLGPATSPPAIVPGQPMIRVADHPALRVFSGDARGFLPLVRVFAKRRLNAIDASAARVVSNSSESDANVLVRLADGSPLLIEAPLGAGRVLALLTTAATGEAEAPPWSNLSTLPVFPVLVNDLVAWLSQERLRPVAEVIGATAQREAKPRDALLRWDGPNGLTASPGLGPAAPLAPASPGVYRRRIEGVDGPVFAASVDNRESDLAAESASDLRAAWAGVAEAARARNLFREDQAPADSTLLYMVVAALLALMIGERWLAFVCSHVGSAAPRPTGAGRAA